MKEPYEVVQKVEDQSSAVKRAMIDAMPMGAHPAAVIFALNDLAGDYVKMWLMQIEREAKSLYQEEVADE